MLASVRANQSVAVKDLRKMPLVSLGLYRHDQNSQCLRMLCLTSADDWQIQEMELEAGVREMMRQVNVDRKF